MKSRFAAITSAEVYGSGQYFELGEFEVEIEQCIYKDSFKSGDLFIFECRVLSAKNPDGTEGAATGCKRTAMVKMANKTTAFSNLLSILAALLGVDTNDKPAMDALRAKGAEILENAAGEEQVLKGNRAHISCVPWTTKDGKAIQVQKWSPVSPEFKG